MSHADAYALYATGLALLGDDEQTTQDLVELADGRVERLTDARMLLHDVAAHPDQLERADLLLVRAITCVEQSTRTATESRRISEGARRSRQRSAQLRSDRHARHDQDRTG